MRPRFLVPAVAMTAGFTLALISNSLASTAKPFAAVPVSMAAAPQGGGPIDLDRRGRTADAWPNESVSVAGAPAPLTRE